VIRGQSGGQDQARYADRASWRDVPSGHGEKRDLPPADVHGRILSYQGCWSEGDGENNRSHTGSREVAPVQASQCRQVDVACGGVSVLCHEVRSPGEDIRPEYRLDVRTGLPHHLLEAQSGAIFAQVAAERKPDIVVLNGLRRQLDQAL